jgi:hypothetical protein
MARSRQTQTNNVLTVFVIWQEREDRGSPRRDEVALELIVVVIIVIPCQVIYTLCL